jgi:hypothetical protein
MSLKKCFITIALFFSLLGVADFSAAKETQQSTPELLKEIDTKIDAALAAIPSGKAEEVVALIKAISDSTVDLNANYKFEFERDKVTAKVKKARDAAKKNDLPAAEQELKAAKEGFVNLKKFL